MKPIVVAIHPTTILFRFPCSPSLEGPKIIVTRGVVARSTQRPDREQPKSDSRIELVGWVLFGGLFPIITDDGIFDLDRSPLFDSLIRDRRTEVFIANQLLIANLPDIGGRLATFSLLVNLMALT